MTEQAPEGMLSWEEAERLVDEKAKVLASAGQVIATVNTPISISGLRRVVQKIKQAHGHRVQVVPHEWGIEFVLHERGVVPR